MVFFERRENKPREQKNQAWLVFSGYLTNYPSPDE
jgi:hypothetical protein